MCVQKVLEVSEVSGARDSRLCTLLGGQRGFRRFTFDQFRVTAQNQRAFQAAKGFDYKRQNLFLHGAGGVGKSHLAGAILRTVFEQTGRRVESVSPPALLRALRCAENMAAAEAEAIARLTNADCLLIDDLAAEKATEYAVGILREIVDGRWMAERNGLIVTSNLSPQRLAERIEDDRLISRLVGLCGREGIVQVAGKDWRLSA